MTRSLAIPRRRVLGASLAAASAVALSMSFGATVAQAAEGHVLYAGAADSIKNSYVVVFKDSAVSARSVHQQATSKAAQYGGKVAYTYSAALHGFAATMSEQ